MRIVFSRPFSRSFARLLAPLVLCAAAAAEEAPAWSTGRELAQQLALPVSISWDNAPLERALAGLAASQQLAIYRDRRIDPSLPLRLSIDDQPLSVALAEIARHLDIGYCQFGPVAYFGPPASAARLRTLAALRREEARALGDERSRKALLMRSWQWDRLAEPRALVEQLAAELGAELSGADRVAHDVWPAADLPLLSWIDRLTLVAAQFDLTFRFDDDGRRLTLIDVPASPALVRDYLGGRDAAAVARRWSRLLPEATIHAQGNTIRVTAPLEDHEQLTARMQGQPKRRTTVTAGQQVYQLSVDNKALDQVIAQLAAQLELEFNWQQPAIDQAGIAVDQLISVRVADADLDALLTAVFDDTQLTFRRRGRDVEVRPR